MDVIALTNQLINQPEKIIKVLERLGCEKIKYNDHKKYITSTRPEEGADNALGLMCFTDTLGVHMNTRAYKGNIFSLVMDTKRVSFPDALKLVSKWTGVKNDIQIKYPFHHFYKSIYSDKNDAFSLIPIYSEDRLPPRAVNIKYIKDGVSALTQERFDMRFSLEENAIVTPIYDCQGNLVGAKARNNDANCDDTHRFWAYLEYPKNQTVYGYVQNYRNIIDKKKILIAESEKAVMQAASMGCDLCLAVGGKNISDTQAKYIKSLGADRIYVAFDEGVCFDEMEYQAKKLIVNNGIYKNKIGCIIDEDHDILKKGSKDSPFDHGKEVLNKLIKEKVRWL